MRPACENKVVGADTAGWSQKDVEKRPLHNPGTVSIALVSLYKETLILHFVLAFVKEAFFVSSFLLAPLCSLASFSLIHLLLNTFFS